MNHQFLSAITEDLPYAIRHQVVSYAQSVYDASPDIARDAGIAPSAALADRLAFFAGLKKLHAILSSSFWALDNSAALMRSSDVASIRIGGRKVSPGSDYHIILKNASDALDSELRRLEIRGYLELPYPELAVVLTHDGSS